MNAPVSILVFDDVLLAASDDAGAPQGALRLALAPGGAAVLDAADRPAAELAADAACGMAEPQSGVVRFLDRDWRTCPPRAAAAQRSRIGRVFAGTAWLGNLDIDENILLAARHHTTRPEAELRAEARRLALSFGLAELPATRPAWTGRRDLRRSQWVRALLGERALLVLEDPADHVAAEDVAQLLEALSAFRTRGGAVLWIATPGAAPAPDALRPDLRLSFETSAPAPSGGAPSPAAR